MPRERRSKYANDAKDTVGIASQVESLSSSLAESMKNNTDTYKNKLSSGQVSVIKGKKHLVSFVDDDGNKAIMTKLMPISETYGIPFTIGLIVDQTENGTAISIEQAKDLQDRLKWEVAAHTYTHIGLGDANLTDAQIEHEVADSIEYFRSKGLNVKNFIYAGGQASARAIQITSKYVNAALGTGTAQNIYPLQTYNLNRLPFPSDAPNDTLDYYKSKVDEAVANNQWLIWMLHCGQSSLDEVQLQHLRDLITYVQSLGIETPTIQDGIDKVGNILDINDREFYIDASGDNNVINTLIYNIGIDGQDIVKISDLPNSFSQNKVTVSMVNNNRNISPTQRGGVLVTNCLTIPAFTSQTFVDQAGIQLNRHAISETQWSSWVKGVSGKSVITTTITGRTVAAGTAFWTVIEDASIISEEAHVAQPVGTLELGLTWQCWSHGNGAVIIEIYNPTNADIIMANREFRIHRHV
jgi:peptidoglycan/xylan/chitin deacetylase (PgdA/CDA1 family)